MSERARRFTPAVTDAEALQILREEVPGRVATHLPQLRPFTEDDILVLGPARFAVQVKDDANDVTYLLGPYAPTDLTPGFYVRVINRIFADFN